MKKKLSDERFQWSSFMIVVKLRAMLTKTFCAPNIDERNIVRVRDSITMSAGFMAKFYMKSLGWHQVLSFMREYCQRQNVYKELMKYCEIVKKVQHRFKGKQYM